MCRLPIELSVYSEREWMKLVKNRKLEFCDNELDIFILKFPLKSQKW